jgi:hypothetical protein
MFQPLQSNDEAPQQLRKTNSRRLLGLLLILGIFVLILGTLGAWSQFRKFSEIDHSSDSLRVDLLPTAPMDSNTTTQTLPHSETTYRNGKVGILLRLPGTWASINAANVPKPDAAHRFCVLRSQDRIYAMFWPVFPDFLPSVDADAKVLSEEFVKGGFALRGQRNLLVRGEKAVLLQFASAQTRVDMNLLVLRRGFVRYLLAITGSRSDTSWKQVEDSLTESVEFR